MSARTHRADARLAPCISLAALLLAGCTTTKGVSLRVATYNTHLISPLMRCAVLPDLAMYLAYLVSGVIAPAIAADAVEFAECVKDAGDIAPDEAKLIAAAITSADYDVIALNEVFDNDAKDTLVDALKDQYPYYVKYFKEGSAVEDSGLMIFSRFPFLPLPKTEFQAEVDGSNPNDVAFRLFEDCDGVDCHADKGAALVRVQVDGLAGAAGSYTLVFAHFQADSGFEKTRRSQMHESAYVATATVNSFHDEKVLIMGDFNVMGEGAVEDMAAKTYDGPEEWQGQQKQNLDLMANGTGQLDFIYDMWASVMPKEDVGHTYPSSKRRYDYIMGNQLVAHEAGCIQQMKTRQLGPSDHIALFADVNAQANFCSPRTAWDNPPLDTKIEAQKGATADVTEIAHIGGMQWFHVTLDAPRTMSIAVDPPYDPKAATGVDVELYSPYDMSTPLPNYLSETTFLPALDMKAKKFVTPKDFYLRVYSPNARWKGDYTIAMHAHTCQSLEEACVLVVNQPQVFASLFLPNAPVGQTDSAWFQIDVTDEADSGAPQPIHFFATGLNPAKFELAFLDKSNPTQSASLKNTAVTAVPGGLVLDTVEPGTLGLYMNVRRKDLTVGSALAVGWKSPLTRLHGDDILVSGAKSMRLVCLDETNGTAGNEMDSDEIHLQLNVDGVGWKQIFGADYDCNNQSVIKGVGGVFRFLNDLKIRVIEGDGGGNDDDYSDTLGVSALPVDTFELDADPRVINEYKWWKFEGGHYEFYYSLSHPTPKP